MTDDLGPLRQAMSDLSEYGGSTDLYERSVRKSRRTQRRVAVATGTAAVALVAAVGGAVTFAADRRPGPPAPPVAGPGSAEPADPTCPPISLLEGLVELPPGWSFASSEVECAQTWAAADVRRPSAGNVRYLFHWTAGTGWRYQDQGTGWKCQDLGVTQPAPFCD